MGKTVDKHNTIIILCLYLTDYLIQNPSISSGGN